MLYACSPDNCDTFGNVTGLSFCDITYTPIDEEFLQDVWSQGAGGIGGAKLWHYVVGLLEQPFCHLYRVLECF